MPTQADIRNYIVPANNNVESTSQVINLADSVRSDFVRQVCEQFIEEFNINLTEQQVEYNRSQILQNQKMTEKLDQMMLESHDLKNRLNVAERTSAAALDEVAALRGEINELKNALSQRQDTTMRDSDHEVEDEMYINLMRMTMKGIDLMMRLIQ